MKVQYKFIWDNKPSIDLFTYLMNNLMSINKNVDHNKDKTITVYSCFKYNTDTIDKLEPKGSKGNLNIFYTGERFLDDINADITVGFLPSNIEYNIYKSKFNTIDLENIITDGKTIMIVNSNKPYRNKHLGIINHPLKITSQSDKRCDSHKIYIQIRDQEREHLEFLLHNNVIDCNIFNNLGKVYKHISLYKDLNDKWLEYGDYLNESNLYTKKQKFCCFIVSNPACWQRNEFFNMLSQYKTVHSLGRLFKNVDIDFIVPDRRDKNAYYAIISQYRFMITFENHSLDWYHTEKIYNAFQARTIPIYWGDPMICDVYNKNTFINVRQFDDKGLQLAEFGKVIDDIIHLENNPTKYINMFKNKPVLYAEDEDTRLAENCYYLANELFK